MVWHTTGIGSFFGSKPLIAVFHVSFQLLLGGICPAASVVASRWSAPILGSSKLQRLDCSILSAMLDAEGLQKSAELDCAGCMSLAGILPDLLSCISVLALLRLKSLNSALAVKGLLTAAHYHRASKSSLAHNLNTRIPYSCQHWFVRIAWELKADLLSIRKPKKQGRLEIFLYLDKLLQSFHALAVKRLHSMQLLDVSTSNICWPDKLQVHRILEEVRYNPQGSDPGEDNTVCDRHAILPSIISKSSREEV